MAARLYPIGEASRLVGVSSGTLRSWERRGLITPHRSRAGYRLYSREDIRRLTRVRRMRHAMGVNPAGIAMILTASPPRLKNAPAPRHPEPSLGRKLRGLRQDRGLTLGKVSAKTGLSPSFVSMLERSMANASIASLKLLVDLYGLTLRELLGSDSETDRSLVRAAERRVLPSMASGVTVEELAEGKRLMSCQLVRIAPGAGSGGSYAHEGEEFVFVLSGQLRFVIEEIDRYELRRGDSLYFPSTQPYSWVNPSEREAVVLWINTPPSL
jgi:DNA-binding transcriptional MerR regulator/quercetin dioxygenase-like cupin family protein